MGPRAIIIVTPEGVEPPEIQADTEQDQAHMAEALEKIQPCLDVADAIIKKTSAGPRG